MTLTKQRKQENKSLDEKEPELVNKRENMNFNCLNIRRREEYLNIASINLLIYNIFKVNKSVYTANRID